MIGRVTPAPEALITLKIRGASNREIEVQAVIDTGFTDYLTLPHSIIDDLRLTFVDTSECELADGQIVNMESFQATVLWHGLPREIVVLAADGDPLVGMSLLYQSRLMIDVLDDGVVSIEPIG